MTNDSQVLLTELKLIFDTVLKFCRALDNLYTIAMQEVDNANAKQKKTEKRSLHVSVNLYFVEI